MGEEFYLEVLRNIQQYMQDSIDKGYHKFIYNDLGYDEKCVDIIEAINTFIDKEDYIPKSKVREIIQKYYDKYEKEKEYRYTVDVEEEQSILREIEKELLQEGDRYE